MKLIIMESPYAGELQRNLDYARRGMWELLLLGYAPLASHLLYTQPGVLDDKLPDERELGIAAGLAWRKVAEKAIFLVDYGMSKGMKAAQELYIDEGFPFEYLHIGKNNPHSKAPVSC